MCKSKDIIKSLLFNPSPWGGILHIPLTCGTILDPPEHHRAPPRESWRWPRWLYRWTASGANHSSFPQRSPHWRTPNWPGWLPFCSCWSPNLIFFRKSRRHERIKMHNISRPVIVVENSVLLLAVDRDSKTFNSFCLQLIKSQIQ